MTKQFTLLQLFSLVDGRLSTSMDDVYDMLNHICDEEGLMTHHLPVAMKYLKQKQPKWFAEVTNDLHRIGCIDKNTNFNECLTFIKKNNMVYDIPQLKDEFNTSDFGNFMVDNSLLLQAFAN